MRCPRCNHSWGERGKAGTTKGLEARILELLNGQGFVTSEQIVSDNTVRALLRASARSSRTRTDAHMRQRVSQHTQALIAAGKLKRAGLGVFTR